jgi:precorrin-6B C5,15-methyltransferase / cobalt-precorrin-6B C5,C15-methyltransferase
VAEDQEIEHQVFRETKLTAGDLVLRPLTDDDIDDITLACQDAETLQWLPLPRPYTRASAEWFVRTFAPSQRDSGAGIVFAIEDAGRLVGAIDLKDVSWAEKVAAVGYWVAPWARARGIATQATRALCRWAIREQGFERVELRAATGNVASQRVAQKAGLTREGLARNADVLPDRRVDMVVYSLIPADLPESGSREQHQSDAVSTDEQSEVPGEVVGLVGIGADGWTGLTSSAVAMIEEAGVVLGGKRQLDLLPETIAAERVPWPSPLRPAVRDLVAAHRERGLVVLASGDPMFYGIGRALAEELGPQSLRVLPHPSSISLACARLGWPIEDAEVVSLVGRPLASLTMSLHDRRRILVLSNDAATPLAVAQLLTDKGFGGSALTVLEQLGSPEESRLDGVAHTWASTAGGQGDPLNVVAVECAVLHLEGPRLGLTTGLPDAAYEDDGQLTKREVRAVTLAGLAPSPGELLWDIGGGAGSIAVEWMRSHRSCRAIAVESDPERAARIGRNAQALGVPGLQIVEGRAPAALAGLPTPDAVFIGGGLTTEGMFDTVWTALRPGGRLIANTVTLESEARLVRWYARYGGELTRIGVSRAKAMGGFTGWQQAMPVTQWSVTKPAG